MKKEEKLKDSEQDLQEKKVEEEKEEANNTENFKKEPSPEEEIENWKNKYYFALADLKNLAMQNERDRQSLLKYCSQDLTEALLPVLDSFEIAFKVKPPSLETENYLKGFEFIYNMLQQSLQSKGVEVIEPKKGDKYDIKLHHASEVEEIDEEEQIDRISQVMLKGYKIHDRVIRPANVKVYVMNKKEKENGGN